MRRIKVVKVADLIGNTRYEVWLKGVLSDILLQRFHSEKAAIDFAASEAARQQKPIRETVKTFEL
jgi:hypothetical protein